VHLYEHGVIVNVIDGRLRCLNPWTGDAYFCRHRSAYSRPTV